MRGFLTLLLAAAVTVVAAPAIAHPHVWVTTRAELVYAPDGRLTGIRHAWTFDESYSAYVTEGMITNGRMDPKAARELAQTNIDSLADSNYFTDLRLGGAKQEFGAPEGAVLGLDGKQLTLNFTLPLKTPAKTNRVLLDVYDPTFFVDFTVAEGDEAVRLSGAPAGCTATVQRPKPDVQVNQSNLSEAFFQALTDSNYGAQFANRAVVTCR